MSKFVTTILRATYALTVCVSVLSTRAGAQVLCSQSDLQGKWVFHVTHTRASGTTAQQNDLVCPVTINSRGRFRQASCFQIEQSAFEGALLINGRLKVTSSTCGIKFVSGADPNPAIDVRIFTGPNANDFYGFLFNSARGWLHAKNNSFSLVMATSGNQYAGRIIAFRRQ